MGASGSYYLRAHDTGVLHYIGGFYYDDEYDPETETWPFLLDTGGYEARVLAGVYDVLYSKGLNSDGTIAWWNDPTQLDMNAARLLATDVVIVPGANTLDIDLGVAVVAGDYLLGGAPLPPETTYYASGSYYLRAHDTGVLHYIGGFYYDDEYDPETETWPFLLDTGSYEARVVPGLYDVLYSTGLNSDGTIAWWNDPAQLDMNAHRILRRCVLVP